MPIKVPDTGPLPTPESPAEAREFLKAAAFESPDIDEVEMVCEEFTSLCPKTGQPDFGSVTITYRPQGQCLESRALKYYMWSYRNQPAFCEAVAAQIANDVVYAIGPARVDVEVAQSVRGGIRIYARASRQA